MSGAALVADSIAKAYVHRRVLTSARLVAQRGAITLVAGRNGSGKTTLLRIISGVESADFGVVRYGGQAIARPALYKLAWLGLFYLPDREILSPVRPLGDQLATMARRFKRTGIADAASGLGIVHLLDRKPRTFSGGELRRAEVGLAVVRQPSYLIADEPLRGLDPLDAEVVLTQLRTLADGGCTVVVSGHDAATLLPAANAVAWVTSGTTYMFDSPDAAMRNDSFRREYLTGQWTERRIS